MIFLGQLPRLMGVNITSSRVFLIRLLSNYLKAEGSPQPGRFRIGRKKEFFIECQAHLQSEPYPAGHARRWPAQGTASSFPKTGAPSSAGRFAHRNRPGAWGGRPG